MVKVKSIKAGKQGKYQRKIQGAAAGNEEASRGWRATRGHGRTMHRRRAAAGSKEKVGAGGGNGWTTPLLDDILSWFCKFTKFKSQLQGCEKYTTRIFTFTECPKNSAKADFNSVKTLPTNVLGKAYSAYTLLANRFLPSSVYRALGKVFAECQTWCTAKKSDWTERSERRCFCRVLWRALGKACDHEQKKATPRRPA